MDIERSEPLRVVARKAFGGDLMTVYAMQELPCSPD
jgi:hypothetical protein